MSVENNLTTTFNLTLVLYIIVVSIFSGFNESSDILKMAFQGEGPQGGTLALYVIGFLSILLLLIYWGATLFKKFWNLFLMDVFKVRAINNTEALALILMTALFWL